LNYVDISQNNITFVPINMKKQFISLMVMLVFALTSSNAQTLFGVPFDGNAYVFATNLTKKGFVLKQNNTKIKNVYIMSGQVLNRQCEIYVFGSAKTNKLFRVVAYTPKELTFSGLSQTFDVVSGYLKEKYGEGERECLDYFKTPYELGDGYEMTAVATGNYIRMCVFGDNVPNVVVMTHIEEYPQVRIVWEHQVNVETHLKETKQKANEEL
jgi:hypothetical protein